MSKNKKLFSLILLLLLIGFFSFIAFQSLRSVDDITGEDIYNNYCIACHGTNGKGDGSEAYRLNIKPTDFTSGYIKFKSTPYGTKPTIDDIISTLKLGVRTTAMLPQLQLSSSQMDTVASYIISFMPKDQKRGKPIEISNAPPMNETLLKEGEKLFQTNCVSCHGKDAKGNGLLSKELIDYKKNPIHPPDLTLRPLKRANTTERMYLIISTGIEGTPMPSFQQVLKPRERWAIVDYVESLKSGYRSSNNNGMMGGMMGGMMKHRSVGEEFKGMQIDMAAARAWMMGNMMGR
ncbi:Cbb3-type cytochrome c oxidase subunit FixP [bacterium BMS3Abin03]|nr:Cbb3-type cytochrome c oxidase subunit FixP [bacterium BMS3Abin03]